MTKDDVIKRFMNFAPVTKEELRKAIEATQQEEDTFWKTLAKKESNNETESTDSEK